MANNRIAYGLADEYNINTCSLFDGADYLPDDIELVDANLTE